MLILINGEMSIYCKVTEINLILAINFKSVMCHILNEFFSFQSSYIIIGLLHQDTLPINKQSLEQEDHRCRTELKSTEFR